MTVLLVASVPSLKYGAGVTATFVYDAKGELIAEYGSAPPPCQTRYVT